MGLEKTAGDSFVITFHMGSRVNRVITPVKAAQAEKMCRDYDVSHIEFDCKALWDTGSMGCCIDKDFAEGLGLKRYGADRLLSANGFVRSDLYLLDISLPDNVTIQSVPVATVNSGGSFDIIIGMNIISMGKFVLDLVNGETVMSFDIYR